MKMEQTECSETSAYKFQTPGNHPKESIQQIFLSPLSIKTSHVRRPVYPFIFLVA